MFSWLKNKQTLFSKEQIQQIQQNIAYAEKKTSGEIRLFVERCCKYRDPLERAKIIFLKHQMDKTQNRNAVLIYLAFENHVLAIFGDEGIDKRVGQAFWQQSITGCITHFKKEKYTQGLSELIINVGDKLKIYFPFEKNDKNELSNEILFGKV